ncbi:MAG TPA: glycosyltransferase family 39 protein [Candidatus Acidoferrales bacterium]|nr:glycosyltransferase family 39 protein [Candidatus Acidoferrales bacterium]
MTVSRLFWPAVACVAAVVGSLEVRSALGETQTWDEGIHISAGYTYLLRGDYSWNMEHPPLVKLVSALPLAWLHLDLPAPAADGKRRDQVQYGIEFLYRNRVHADTILMAARSANILLTLLFLAALAWWTRRRFGEAAALLAVVLCAFDPNLIAHGRYVTTDFPVTVFYFFACVLWVEYLERGSFRSLLPAALVFTLAMLTKFSAILLIPTFLVLYAVRWVQRPKEFPLRRLAVAGSTVLAAGCAGVLAIYWPETVRCLTTKVPLLADVVNRENLVGDALWRLGRTLHLPAHRFLVGLNAVAEHNAGGHNSYLLGLRSDAGWWYYFPVVFAVKSTVAALLAAATVLAAGLWRAARAGFRHTPGFRNIDHFRNIPILTIGLAFPPVFYFVLSMTSGINIGMRHILPVYPFLYIGVAAMVMRWFGTRRKLAALGLALGLGQILECSRIAPDYLAFFNAFVGGPGNGPLYLADSNIDWGQDVKKLVHWLDAHGTRRARVFYFGNAQMRYYGVDELGFPGPRDQQGWNEIDDYCVASVTPLLGNYVPLEDLAQLRLREPVAKVGWSMYVYDLRKKK